MAEEKPWERFAREFLREEAEAIEKLAEDCLAKGLWPTDVIHGEIRWRGNMAYRTTWIRVLPKSEECDS